MAATTQVKVAAFRTSEPLDSTGIRPGCIATIAISTGGILTRLLEAMSATCLNESPRHISQPAILAEVAEVEVALAAAVHTHPLLHRIATLVAEETGVWSDEVGKRMSRRTLLLGMCFIVCSI
jgi:hypothetical protein